MPHLYVHYDDGAVSHLFHVAAGLDSMVVGEGQILGQTREALRVGQEAGTIGPALNVLFQQALRVGKRVHAETDIDRAAPSLVSARPRPRRRRRRPARGQARRSSSAPARWPGSPSPTVTPARRRRGRGRQPHRGARPPPRRAVRRPRGARSPRSREALADADVLVSCTGATGVVLPLSVVAAARAGADRPLAVVDLALPHDVDPAVADLPGVSLFDLARLAEEVNDGEARADVAAVREIVAQEVAAFLAARRSADRDPDRRRAAHDGHRDRRRRDGAARRAGCPTSTPPSRAEVEHAVRRVADKLLHQPTVRVKELANETGAVSYAAALAELFALDPEAVEAVDPARRSDDGHEPATIRSAPAPRCSPAPSPSSSPTARATALGRDVELVEVTTEGDVVRARRWPQLGGTGVFVSALREALLRGDVDLAVHSLKDLPDRRRRRHRAGRRTRRARTRATSSSPATGSPSASCRPARASAPARRDGPRSCTRSASVSTWSAIRGNVDTRIGKVRVRRRTTPSCSPAPGWPGSAGSTRSPRCSTRCRCCPPPGRARWRSSAAADDDLAAAVRARSTTRARRAAVDRRARRARRPSRPAARPRSGPWPRSPRATTATSSGCGRWRSPPTARSPYGGPPPVARTTPPRLGRQLAEEMLADGASTLIEEQTSTTTTHRHVARRRLRAQAERKTRARRDRPRRTPTTPRPRAGWRSSGSGPGDPGLLTVRAVDLLARGRGRRSPSC